MPYARPGLHLLLSLNLLTPKPLNHVKFRFWYPQQFRLFVQQSVNSLTVNNLQGRAVQVKNCRQERLYRYVSYAVTHSIDQKALGVNTVLLTVLKFLIALRHEYLCVCLALGLTNYISGSICWSLWGRTRRIQLCVLVVMLHGVYSWDLHLQSITRFGSENWHILENWTKDPEFLLGLLPSNHYAPQ